MKTCTLLITFTAVLFSLFGKDLHVFYPTTLYPQFFQEKISKEIPKNLTVVVFGRYEDFISQVQSQKPTMILTLPELTHQLQEYSSKLEGIQAGGSREPYCFLSTADTFSEETIANTTIGLIDFLGKKEMESSIRTAYGDKVKIKRIRKVEDLLPLLLYDMVDAILIPRRYITFFEKQSSIEFHVSEAKYSTSLVSLFILEKSTPQNSVESIQTLSDSILSLFGVEKWK